MVGKYINNIINNYNIMVKLSIVYVARDDRYGDDYNVVEFAKNDIRNNPNFSQNFTIKYNNIQRIKTALDNNIQLLDKYFTDNYEIIFIDWNPINYQYLHSNTELSNIFNKQNVKSIIVSNETIKKTQLNPNGFYEYYGKNVGIRHSNGDLILISNPDEILTEEIVKEMNEKTDDHNKYYRCEYRIDVDHNLKEIARGASFPKNNIHDDEILGTPASGDFTLAAKHILIKMQGYYEVLSSGNEATCDSTLIKKLYNNNIKPVMLKGNILHLDHKKHTRTGGASNNTTTYENAESWGFNNYSLNKITNNVFKI